jgi:hypothetical protein
VCADQQSGQWLENHRLGSRARHVNTRNLPKSVKEALMTKYKDANSPYEMQKWIKDLNPWHQDGGSLKSNLNQNARD